MSTVQNAVVAARFRRDPVEPGSSSGEGRVGNVRPHSYYLSFALIWAGLVLYGALLPFEMRLGAGPAGGSFLSWLLEVMTAPRWFVPDGAASSLGISAAASDLGVNLLLMLPLGGLLRLHLRKRGRPIVAQLLLPAAACFALCWSIESAQSLLVGRYAAIQDVLTNTGGGIVGVLLAPAGATIFRRAVFAVYRRVSYPLDRMRAGLIRVRRSPVTMFLVTGLNLLLIGGWLVSTRGLGAATDSHALPFAGLFEHSYDMGALHAGRAMIVYCLIGGLLSIQFMRLRSRRTLGLMLLALGLIALGRQLVERSGASVFDATELVIAVMAGGLLLTTASLMIHAVRCSCRRKTQIPVPYERRRVRFEYGT